MVSSLPTDIPFNRTKLALLGIVIKRPPGCVKQSVLHFSNGLRLWMLESELPQFEPGGKGPQSGPGLSHNAAPFFTTACIVSVTIHICSKLGILTTFAMKAYFYTQKYLQVNLNWELTGLASSLRNITVLKKNTHSGQVIKYIEEVLSRITDTVPPEAFKACSEKLFCSLILNLWSCCLSLPILHWLFHKGVSGHRNVTA